VAAYAAAIFAMSSSTHPLGVQRLPPGVDKVIHALVFGGFSVTVWFALRSSAPGVSPIRLSSVAVLIATLYGLSDEFHQSFVPGREMDAVDLAADGIGACVAQAFVLVRSAVPRHDLPGSSR
jgi:VanZ family protein